MRMHKPPHIPHKVEVLTFEEEDYFQVETPILPTLSRKERKIPRKIVTRGPFKRAHKIFRRYYDSLVRNNPDFEITYMTHDESREFVSKNFDQRVLNAYDCMIPESYRSDLFRLCYLYVNGGFYTDFNKTHIASISDIYNDDDDFVGILDVDSKKLAIGFVGCVPGLELFQKSIEKIVENVENKRYLAHPIDVTGPGLVGAVFRDIFGYNVLNTGITVINGKKYNFFGKNIGNQVNIANNKVFMYLNHERREWINKIWEKETGSAHYSLLWQQRKIYKED